MCQEKSFNVKHTSVRTLIKYRKNNNYVKRLIFKKIQTALTL